MAKFKTAAVLLAFLAIIALIASQRHRIETLRAEVVTLHEQIQNAASLRGENERLAEDLKTATENAQSNLHELALLRTQAGTVVQLEQENAQLKVKQDGAVKQSSESQAISYDDRTFGQGAHLRVRFGMRWGLALLDYAINHQGQFPPTLQEVVPLLGKDNEGQQAALTADQYEILYQGKLDGMTNPPPEAAIIIREKQPWRTPDGTWARSYVYGNGLGAIQTALDGNFEEWEAPRIPKLSGE